MEETQKPILARYDTNGRPSLIDEINLHEVKKLILKGKTDLEIATAIGVSEATFSNWKLSNYRGFYAFYQQCRVERMLEKAMKTIEDIASMSIDPDNDPRIMKIIYDANALVLERANVSLFKAVKDNEKDKNKAVNLKISSYKIDKGQKVLDNKDDVAQKQDLDNNVNTTERVIEAMK